MSLNRFRFAFAKVASAQHFLYDEKDLIDWPHLCHLYFGRAFTATVCIWHMDPHSDSVIATLLSDAWFVSPFYRALKQRLWWSSFQQWFYFPRDLKEKNKGQSTKWIVFGSIAHGLLGGGTILVQYCSWTIYIYNIYIYYIYIYIYIYIII